MTHCTKNIDKEYFDKTFFIENNNNNGINVYDKKGLSVIDNLNLEELDSSGTLLGQGGFNTVKEFPLSTKCQEKEHVAVRIRKLEMNKHIKKKRNEDDTNDIYTLNKNIETSIDNIIDLSEKELHPKVYEIKVVRSDDINNNFFLIIVMEKYMCSLKDFISKYNFNKDNILLPPETNKLRGPMGIFEYPYEGCPEDNKQQQVKINGEYITIQDHDNGYKDAGYPQDNHKLIIQLIQKTEQLIDGVAGQGYFCYDIKPGNLVVNYDFDEQTVDIKMIDVDADFCVKNMHDNFEKNIATKLNTFNGIQFSRYEIYRYVMMILLSRHLYNQRFNYFAKYFTIFKDQLELNYNKNITNTKDIPDDLFQNTITALLQFINKGGNKPQFKRVLGAMFYHYFNMRLEIVWTYIRYLTIQRGLFMSFCLKNYHVQPDDDGYVKTFNFEEGLNEIKVKENKQVEFIEEAKSEIELKPPSIDIEADPKNTIKKIAEYKEEKQVSEKNTPIFDKLKPYEEEDKAQGKGGTNKTKKFKKLLKKSKKKLIKLKRNSKKHKKKETRKRSKK